MIHFTGKTLRLKATRKSIPLKCPPKTELYYKYLTLGSISKLAEYYKTTKRQVRQWLKDSEIYVKYTHRPKVKRPDKDSFIKILHSYEHLNQIANYYKVSTLTINRWMKYYGTKR